jgi:hypothetical protein
MHRRLFTLALTSLLASCTDIPNSYRGMHWHLSILQIVVIFTDNPTSLKGLHWQPFFTQSDALTTLLLSRVCTDKPSVRMMLWEPYFSPEDILTTLLLSWLSLTTPLLLLECTDNLSSLREMLWQPYFSQCAVLHVLHSHADWCTSNPRSSRGMHWQLFLLQVEALTKTSKLLSELFHQFDTNGTISLYLESIFPNRLLKYCRSSKWSYLEALANARCE